MRPASMTSSGSSFSLLTGGYLILENNFRTLYRQLLSRLTQINTPLYYADYLAGSQQIKSTSGGWAFLRCKTRELRRLVR